jgi:hypothetical protein
MRGFGLLAIFSVVWILLVVLLSAEAVPLAEKEAGKIKRYHLQSC